MPIIYKEIHDVLDHRGRNGSKGHDRAVPLGPSRGRTNNISEGSKASTIHGDAEMSSWAL